MWAVGHGPPNHADGTVTALAGKPSPATALMALNFERNSRQRREEGVPRCLKCVLVIDDGTHGTDMVPKLAKSVLGSIRNHGGTDMSGSRMLCVADEWPVGVTGVSIMRLAPQSRR